MPREDYRLAGWQGLIWDAHTPRDRFQLLKKAGAFMWSAVELGCDEALPNKLHPQVRRAGAHPPIIFLQLSTHASMLELSGPG
jgi:hypothetical protein